MDPGQMAHILALQHPPRPHLYGSGRRDGERTCCGKSDLPEPESGGRLEGRWDCVPHGYRLCNSRTYGAVSSWIGDTTDLAGTRTRSSLAPQTAVWGFASRQDGLGWQECLCCPSR